MLVTINKSQDGNKANHALVHLSENSDFTTLSVVLSTDPIHSY